MSSFSQQLQLQLPSCCCYCSPAAASHSNFFFIFLFFFFVWLLLLLHSLCMVARADELQTKQMSAAGVIKASESSEA
jgi:hypothetical protein